VKKLVNRDRKNRERIIAESAKTNIKNFWRYVNSKRKTKSGISELHTQTNGAKFVISTDREKAEV
jgi:hypothetical protein